ncbi:MAG: transglutaminase domain-containing protein [Candidatus Eisenbacteria sp.]|nr:transglutaminase domain-containing protein [Candidatus Eisenbacteria bacterium]
MNTWIRNAPAALAVAVTLLASAALADDLCDTWFEASLAGATMGYIHQTVLRDADGQTTTTVESDFTMRRGEDLVSINGVDEWVESPDGQPRSYRQTRKMALETLELEMTVGPDRLRLRKSDGRDATFSTMPHEGDILFPAAIEALHVSRGFVTGSEYSFRTFDPDFEEITTYTVLVVGPEKLDILGEIRDVTKLVLTSNLYEGIEFIEWRGSDGGLWREDVPEIEMARERTTSDVALREREAADILAISTIATNVTIRSTREVDDALYEVWVEGGDISEFLTEDARQRIEGTTDRGVLLRVSRVVPEPGTTIQYPVSSTPLKDYLDGNSLMQTWHPRILGNAARAVWDSEQDSWKAAAQIERWVFDHIEDKGLGVAFASAREVLERLSGDCSEHAVLMATMARAVAIPTKMVSGVVHTNGEFAYHMWVEVWTGETWHDLDPTVGDGSVDATHVKLAESAVPGGRVAELSLSVLRVFNRLGIRVIEYTADGETVRASAQ